MCQSILSRKTPFATKCITKLLSDLAKLTKTIAVLLPWPPRTKKLQSHFPWPGLPGLWDRVLSALAFSKRLFMGKITFSLAPLLFLGLSHTHSLLSLSPTRSCDGQKFWRLQLIRPSPRPLPSCGTTGGDPHIFGRKEKFGVFLLSLPSVQSMRIIKFKIFPWISPLSWLTTRRLCFALFYSFEFCNNGFPWRKAAFNWISFASGQVDYRLVAQHLYPSQFVPR